jgi:hypothetical protein
LGNNSTASTCFFIASSLSGLTSISMSLRNWIKFSHPFLVLTSSSPESFLMLLPVKIFIRSLAFDREIEPGSVNLHLLPKWPLLHKQRLWRK